LENLLEPLVDVAHDRGAPQHQLAGADQRAPEQVGRQRADDGEEQDRKHQPDARHRKRHVAVRVVDAGDVRLHPAVHQGDEVPGDVERDTDRANQDEAGEEVVAQASTGARGAAGGLLKRQLGEAGLAAGVVVAGDLGGLPLRVRPRARQRGAWLIVHGLASVPAGTESLRPDARAQCDLSLAHARQALQVRFQRSGLKTGNAASATRAWKPPERRCAQLRCRRAWSKIMQPRRATDRRAGNRSRCPAAWHTPPRSRVRSRTGRSEPCRRRPCCPAPHGRWPPDGSPERAHAWPWRPAPALPPRSAWNRAARGIGPRSWRREGARPTPAWPWTAWPWTAGLQVPHAEAAPRRQSPPYRSARRSCSTIRSPQPPAAARRARLLAAEPEVSAGVRAPAARRPGQTCQTGR